MAVGALSSRDPRSELGKCRGGKSDGAVATDLSWQWTESIDGVRRVYCTILNLLCDVSRVSNLLLALTDFASGQFTVRLLLPNCKGKVLRLALVQHRTVRNDNAFKGAPAQD